MKRIINLHINEKFTPESDPIADMGIGAINKIFELTKACWSFKMGLYSEKEWKRIIEWMLEEYEPWEVIAILDHKIMRYAHDATNSDIPTTLEQFQDYNVKYHKDREEFEIDRILNNYRMFQPDNVEHYRNMAKEIGLFVEPVHEKFTETSTDPIADMGIGGYSWETLQKGALIKLKPNYRSGVALTKNESGQFTGWHHGMQIHPENCLVVTQVVSFDDGRKSIHFKKFSSEQIAKGFRDNWEKTQDKGLGWGGMNNRMIVSKIQFERRFDIIEKGFNIVKESLNEKFTEKSDPLRDMGIGLKKVIADRAKDMFRNGQYDFDDGDYFKIVEIRFDAFTADIITNYPFSVKAAQTYLEDAFEMAELDEFFYLGSITHSEGTDHIFWNVDFKEKYEMIFSMEDRFVINYKTVNESLNEKFSEEGDPVAQMGIGIRKEIDKYIEDNDDGDVENDLITPIMFLCRQGDLDDKTKKDWIEYLLREGKDNIREWENSDFEIMDDIGVRFIPNTTQLPDEKFTYKVKNDQYHLYCSEWADFTYYFEPHNDIDYNFIEKVLSGEGREFFEYNYHRPLKLDEIIDSLSKFEEPELFEFLKPFCEERSEEAKEANNLYELFDIIENSDDLQGVDNALKNAFVNNVAEAEETAAYNELVNTIKRGLKITEATYQEGNLVLKLSEDSVNTFFKMYWSDAYHIDYYPPQYGWGGDFNLEYFKEDFESNLQD